MTFISIFTFALFKIQHYGTYESLFYIFIGLYALNIILPILFALKLE